MSYMQLNESNLPKEYIELMFQFLTQSVFSDGGDGDGYVILKYIDYKSMADAFEKYLKDKNWSYNRINNEMDKLTWFNMNDECFLFTNNTKIEVPSYCTVQIVF